MKIKLQSRYGWCCLAIAALTVSTSGCKSAGFSMPGKNMFSWNRQPDATILAGNTKVPDLPESPAAKYDPAAIASKSGSPAKPAGSAYGYGGATAESAGSASAQPGGAAMANGYQSGPYPLASSAPATTTASTATSGALPSPYGGTYSGSMASINTPSTAAGSGDVPLPNSVTAALAKGAGATAGYPATAATGGGMPPLPNSISGPTGAGTNAIPVGYSNPAPTSAATTAYQLPERPASGQTPAFPASNSYTSGVPSSTAVSALGGNAAGLPALPGSNTTNTVAAGQAGSAATPPSSGSAAPSVYPTTGPSSSYSPGSTGRSTGYDFSSKQSSAAAPANSASGGTLPLLR